MPAVTPASAKLAYEKAIGNLKRACTSLKYKIPPSADGSPEETPLLAPRIRADKQACPLCAPTLEELGPEEREAHVCTHQAADLAAVEVDRASGTGSGDGRPRGKRGRTTQPMAGVVREYMQNLDDRLDKFTDAVTIFCSTLSNDRDKGTYQDHLVVWIEQSEHLKDRA